MIAKKNPRYDLERKRFVFFQTGLLCIGALTLAAFAWESPVVREQLKKSHVQKQDIQLEYVQKEQEQVKPVQERVQQVPQQEQLPQLAFSAQVNENTQTTANTLLQTVSGVALNVGFNPGDLTILTSNIEVGDIDIEEIVIPDIDASFVGGYLAMQEFISKNQRYPQLARELGIQGKVGVQFVVEKDGSITNIKVVRSADEELDREALRLVRSMPKWIAGETKGRKVRTHAFLPVIFVLEN